MTTPKIKTFVTLGEGLAAGVSHFSLSDDVQAYSFPALLAERLGVKFSQPLIEPPGVGNVGFAEQPAIVPELLQTTVLQPSRSTGFKELFDKVRISKVVQISLFGSLWRRDY